MRKVIAFYGTIVLRLEESIAKELDSIWQTGENSSQAYYKPYYDRVLELQNQMHNILNRKKGVKNVRWSETLTKEHFDPFENHANPDEEYLMQFSSPILFDVELPLNKRKYKLSLENSKGYVQNYSVIYNGVVFLAYAFVEDDYSDVDLAPEIRESLEEVLQDYIWTPTAIPPCPIRMKFFVQSFEEANDEELIADNVGLILDETTYESTNDIEDIMLNLFYGNAFYVADFCSLMSLKSQSEQLTWAISSSFDEIQENFKIITRHRYSKKKNKALRRDIFDIYQLLYEYDKALFEYHSDEGLLSKAIDTCEFISPYIRNYILSELSIREYNQNNILNSLSYVEDRLSENRTIRSSISSALIGGFAGFITSAIILIIEKLLSA